MTADRMLAASAVIDHAHPSIVSLASALRGVDRESTARASFEWVRDQIAHSVDARRGPVTCVASNVLREGTGYCYAKSHLLVALLRANGIPSGLVYQRLTLSGPNPPHCLHGLVALELDSGAYFRVDPRGNKPGVDARFEPPIERLAFATPHAGERLFPGVFAAPLPEVLAALRRHTEWDALLRDLPDAETPSRPPDVTLD